MVHSRIFCKELVVQEISWPVDWQRRSLGMACWFTLTLSIFSFGVISNWDVSKSYKFVSKQAVVTWIFSSAKYVVINGFTKLLLEYLKTNISFLNLNHIEFTFCLVPIILRRHYRMLNVACSLYTNSQDISSRPCQGIANVITIKSWLRKIQQSLFI